MNTLSIERAHSYLVPLSVPRHYNEYIFDLIHHNRILTVEVEE